MSSAPEQPASQSSTLSAEAAEFVPWRPSTQVGGQDRGQGSGVKVLAEVPHYLTSCYPFVNPATVHRVKPVVDGAGGVTLTAGGRGPFMANTAAAGNLRPAPTGLCAQTGQIGFVPAAATPHPHPWIPGMQPATTFTPALSMTPLTPGVHLPFDGGTGSAVGRGLLPTPGKGDGLLPTPPYPPINGSTVLASPLMMSYAAAAPQFFLSADAKPETAGTAKGRQGQGGKGRGSSTSRGTQKESLSSPAAARCRTLIMKDICVQTDFNAELADVTLQEKPSVFYRRWQRRNKGSQPTASTDSEEVDSDSGYSSPLHRRNLVSSGTHPVPLSSLASAREAGRTPEVVLDRARSGTALNLLADRRRSGSGADLRAERTRPPTYGVGDGGGESRGGRRSSEALSLGGLSQSDLATKDSRLKPSPGAWGSELPGSALPQQKDPSSRSSGVKDVSGRVGGVQGQKAERSRTPLQHHTIRVNQRTEEESSSSGGGGGGGGGARSSVADSQEPERPPSSLSGGSKTRPSSAGSSTGRLGSHSPGTTRRDLTSSPALPEFPVLKPAKRHEPPWSLTPAVNKGRRVGEGSSGFLGMVADSVKSYASIVKSLSLSPSAPHSFASAVAAPPPDPAPSPTAPPPPAADPAPSLPPSSVVSSSPAASSSWQQPVAGAPATRVESFSAVAARREASAWPDPSVVRPAGGGSSARVKVQGGVASGSVKPPPLMSLVAGPGRPRGGPAWGGGVNSAVSDSCQNDSKPQLGAEGGRASKGGGGAGSGPIQQAPPPPVERKRPIWVTVQPLAQWANQDTPNSSSAKPSGTSQPTVESRAASDRMPDSAGNTSSPQQQQQAPVGNSSALTRVGSNTDMAQQSAAGDKTEDDEETKKKPRRRRHRRRRRRKTAGSGDGEGFSDGMSGLERTFSSSNISRASDITLHFEDELEFPEIGGATSGAEAQGFVPELGSGACIGGMEGIRRVDSASSLSYSDVLRSKPRANDVRSRTQSAPGSCLSGEEGGDENFNSQPGSSGQTPLGKRARKRRKRRELANRAAEAELAEISLEQQMLRELGHQVTGRGSRPSSGSREERSPARGLITDPTVVRQSKGGATPNASGKRLHQPIALNIADMLDAFEKKQSASEKTMMSLGGGLKKSASLPLGEGRRAASGNTLDANAPAKRGKERETPKLKKPSPLKKVILKEREEKKRMRLIGDCDVYADVDMPDNPDTDTDGNHGDQDTDLVEQDDERNPVGLAESDLSQDGMSGRSGDTDQGVSPGADLSPISQTSPLSMSPLTPGASPLNSPIAGYLSRDPVVLRIHSRRFREYCTQILDKDIDACCTSLLHELVRFQDRMYHKDPNKAKAKRRVVLGLREVTKHLKLKKIKCVIISPNLEKIQSKGGLDEALNNILNMCQEQTVPFVFALGRRALGRACAKLVPVSVAGIFNYEGCEEKFHQLISLTHKGREAYTDMVQAVEQEIADNPPPSLSVGSSVPSLYAHMGHSRTPSGCSAISFTSSVLSEPISENYPHAEPETDSKGYEIVRDQDGRVISSARPGGQGHLACPSSATLASYQPSVVDDSDDGNEADTEEVNEGPRRKKVVATATGIAASSLAGKRIEASGTRNSDSRRVDASSNGGGGNKVKVDSRPEAGSLHVDAKADKAATAPASGSCSSAEGTSHQPDPSQHAERGEDGDRDGVGDSETEDAGLPHIDSIHSSSYDLSTEILSQHSSRTLDNSEVLSTHSSRTLGDGSLTPNTEHTALESGLSPASLTPRPLRSARPMNKDRVQSWVESCLPEERDDDGDRGGDDEDDDSSDEAGDGNGGSDSGQEEEEVKG